MTNPLVSEVAGDEINNELNEYGSTNFTQNDVNLLAPVSDSSEEVNSESFMNKFIENLEDSIKTQLHKELYMGAISVTILVIASAAALIIGSIK